ncbi:alpha/beta hydrolase [Stenotrophobium rhamnosiphilum]|uniref:Alpha/beta hydrolase fold-3 domain-containing protein n=1 Tax=Stenotrophobium rhamnosiphilum TaxID=2029166 RepID=A0A2T5MKL7_9GAMM|nr:alpha/beta hydrolase [Stenotrophobium rhamnosiphilum]PTU33110.1 hypothetical protein CJD38_03115 [Stenotrophobium rhamnosiphilum]
MIQTNVHPRSRRRTILISAIALLVLAIVAVKISSFRSGESMVTHLVRVAVLPMLQVKSTMQNVDRYQELVQKRQAEGDARPSDKLKKQFDIRTESIGGYLYYIVSPKNSKPDRAIIYIHGGAYVGPMADFQWNLVKGLAERTGAQLIVPNYPLAPKHDWKDAYAMMAQLYDRLIQQFPANRISITGDSAGGGLALGFSMELRERGKPMPGSIVLFSPFLNLLADNPAQAALEDIDPLLSRPALVWAAKQWARDTLLDDPHVSPVLGNLSDLPPTLIFSGTADLLHVDSLQFVERARAQGVDVTYIQGRNMTHGWSVLPLPEAAPLYDATAGFIARH